MHAIGGRSARCCGDFIRISYFGVYFKMALVQKYISRISSIIRLTRRTFQKGTPLSTFSTSLNCSNKAPAVQKIVESVTSTSSRSFHKSGSTGQLERGRLVKELDADNDGKVLSVAWEDDSVSRYNSSWLRFNCHCKKCMQPFTGQKLVSIQDFPHQPTINSFSLQDDDTSIAIRFSGEGEEGHLCMVPTLWLKQHSYSPGDLEHRARMRDIGYLDSALGSFNLKEVTSSEDSLFEWLNHLNVYGLTLMRDVPVLNESVAKVASLIGPITETLYGCLFDVKTEEQPINVAYSNVGLHFHMDLAYYESPPGLQLLHCLQFEDRVTGGESIFIDSFHVAEEFRSKFPHHFETLTRVPATFQKFHFERANPAAYIYQRPHINVSGSGKITAVTWSPQFEGPLSVPEEDVEAYYRAYREFSIQLDNPKKRISYRLQPGDCLIFNNRRILHGRTEFQQNGGARHLQGCYVNIDDFRSKVQYLNEKRNTGQLAKRVGNQCLF